MGALILTLMGVFASFLFVYPPLALFLFVFLDPITTPGTAAMVPYQNYISQMAWGGLLGAAFRAILSLYNTRNVGPDGRFAWRVGKVCVLMIVLIRLSRALKADLWGVGAEPTSAGILALIITLAYLHDRRAWWCLGLLLVLQVALSTYIMRSPQSQMNAVYLTEDSMFAAETLTRKMEEGVPLGILRPQAQFASTLIMAMYAVVGLGASLSLLIASHSLTIGRRILAVMSAIGMGITCTALLLASTSRGPIIGFVIGIHIIGLRALGMVRALLVAFAAGASIYFSLPLIFSFMSKLDSIFLDRFALLSNIRLIQQFRGEFIVSGFDVVLSNPFFGLGDFWNVLQACNSIQPHIGPVYLAACFGIPVGLMACAILIWAAKSDFTFGRMNTGNAGPASQSIRAFSTLCGWTAILLFLTNPTGDAIVFIALGIAMWPMVYRRCIVTPATQDNIQKNSNIE